MKGKILSSLFLMLAAFSSYAIEGVYDIAQQQPTPAEAGIDWAMIMVYAAITLIQLIALGAVGFWTSLKNEKISQSLSDLKSSFNKLRGGSKTVSISDIETNIGKVKEGIGETVKKIGAVEDGNLFTSLVKIKDEIAGCNLMLNGVKTSCDSYFKNKIGENVDEILRILSSGGEIQGEMHNLLRESKTCLGKFYKRVNNFVDGVPGKLEEGLKPIGEKVDTRLNEKLNEIETRLNNFSGENKKSLNEFSVELKNLTAQIEEINTELGDLCKKLPAIKDMHKKMNALIENHPQLVMLSISNSAELVKACQDNGLANAGQICEASAFTRTCKESGFTSDSLSLIEKSKEYYDSHEKHENEKKQLEQKLASTEGELSEVKSSKDSLEEEKGRLEQARNDLSDKLFAAQKKCDIFYPENAELSSLCNLLEPLSAELHSEILVLTVQLYWYAQLFRNAPGKVKSAFTKFDETLYELLAENQELLQEIRQSISTFINTEVFKDTSYQISWPLLGASASEQEELYNRENDEGNRICKVRSAVVKNSGNIESVARIYTAL